MTYPQSEVEKNYTPKQEQAKDYVDDFSPEQKFWLRIWAIVGVVLVSGFLAASIIATKMADSQYEQTKLLAPYIAKAYAEKVKRGDWGL